MTAFPTGFYVINPCPGHYLFYERLANVLMSLIRNDVFLPGLQGLCLLDLCPLVQDPLGIVVNDDT